MAVDTSQSLTATRCHLYTPGHSIHYLKLRKEVEVGGFTWSPGKVVGFDGDLIVVQLHDGLHRYWNHRPDQLHELGAVGKRVSVCPTCNMIESGHNGRRLSVADADIGWRACE